MLMERVAEIIRGWPYDGARESSEQISAGATLVNGDWVTKQSDGTVNKTGSTSVGLNGLVVIGNGDSASAANANEAVVLWGNFVARVSNYAAGSYAPGVAVTSKNGVPAVAVLPNMSATPPTLGDFVVGYVTSVVAASTGANPQTAHINISVA